MKKIKQYVIINNGLKMSKGKIARVCLMLGVRTNRILGFIEGTCWAENNYKATVLKSDNYNQHLLQVKSLGVDYFEHIDAGLTQVEAGSSCGIVFFHEEDLFVDLKLV